MNYRETIAELESLGVMPDRPPSLETMRRAIDSLALADRIDPDRVIVVAGTNGKGSVSATLATLLEAAGFRTGLYTSPHLVETTERIRIDGKDLSPERFAELYGRVRETIRRERLSHFEALTLMAAWELFSGEAGRPVDWAVLEVGLGGLWDATNAIPHRRCVVTALGRDHENLLGSSIESIARNKFGILAPGSVAVHAPLPAEAEPVARDLARATGSRLREAPCLPFEAGRGPDGPRFMLATPWGEAELALAGSRGAANTSVALAALEELCGVEPGPLLGALKTVRWPGRMERLQGVQAPCPVYLSGDHNPQGIASLLELLPWYPRRHLHIVAGVGKDKDLDGILGPLAALADSSLHLTQTPFRGRALEDYGAWLERAASASARPEEALSRALGSAREGDLILVTGSLYLVGEIRGRFG